MKKEDNNSDSVYSLFIMVMSDKPLPIILVLVCDWLDEDEHNLSSLMFWAPNTRDSVN